MYVGLIVLAVVICVFGIAAMTILSYQYHLAHNARLAKVASEQEFPGSGSRPVRLR